MEDLIQRIEAIIHDEQLFRNPELTIRDVARELATNRLYISRAINTTFGYSFTVYLNRKRIEYSIALMSEHPMMTMENVATESGFVSETAFFRKFKQIMNDSPRSYMKKIKPWPLSAKAFLLQGLFVFLQSPLVIIPVGCSLSTFYQLLAIVRRIIGDLRIGGDYNFRCLNYSNA